MNIMSSLIGITIMGASAPMMMQMSIAPFEAQKRAENLGIAESSAVTYAALNEGQDDLTDIPDNCELNDEIEGALTITCTQGTGTRYVQTVSRSFRSDVDMGGYAGNQRVFPNATPQSYEPHRCYDEDPWGVQYTNAQWKKLYGWGACTPAVLWNKNNYLASNPDDWLYDISEYGFGAHPDY